MEPADIGKHLVNILSDLHLSLLDLLKPLTELSKASQVHQNKIQKICMTIKI